MADPIEFNPARDPKSDGRPPVARVQSEAASVPTVPAEATCDWTMFQDVRCGAKATERSGLNGLVRWVCKPHKKMERVSPDPLHLRALR